MDLLAAVLRGPILEKVIAFLPKLAYSACTYQNKTKADCIPEIT